MAEFDFFITTRESLMEAVNRLGFLPLFANSIPGFSVEEHVAPSAWFGSEEGVWEWKGPVIRETGCAYGKFFENKAAFISREWFPDFANYRRDGYDFDARWEDELASYRDKQLYDLLAEKAPILSKHLKTDGDYRKGGRKGFDTIMARLQAQCYAVVSDFVYERDRQGRQYGWGVAEYSIQEKWMGADFCSRVYVREPQESHGRVLERLCRLAPWAGEDALRRFLK